MKLSFEVDTNSEDYHEDLRQVAIISSSQNSISCIEDMLSYFSKFKHTDMTNNEFEMVSRIREELAEIVSEYKLFDLLY